MRRRISLVEAYFDGVCEPRNPGGHGAWGALVKVDGREVWSSGGYCGVGKEISNNVSEYSGCAAAIEEASKYPGPIIVRGDSKLVIMQLLGKWRVNGGLYMPYYLKAKQLYEREKQRLTLQWIPRQHNEECDVLSKKVLKDMGVKFRIQPE